MTYLTCLYTTTKGYKTHHALNPFTMLKYLLQQNKSTDNKLKKKSKWYFTYNM